MDLIVLIIEIVLMLVWFKLDSISDAMDRIESILEDINNKLGEKEED